MLAATYGHPQQERRSRVHPAVKVLWLVTGCLIATVHQSPAVLVTLLAVLWALSVTARLDLPSLWRVTLHSLPFCLALMLIQVALHRDGPPALDLGAVRVYRSALEAGLMSALRIQCLASLGAQFWLWVHPTDLALILVGCHLPYRYAFLPTLAFRSFPLLTQELWRLLDGQQLLGLDLSRRWEQVRSIPRVLMPFCLRSLRVGEDMALAMELRAFGASPERTYLRTISMRWWDYALAVPVLAVAVWLLV